MKTAESRRANDEKGVTSLERLETAMIRWNLASPELLYLYPRYCGQAVREGVFAGSHYACM